jgi:preprotein translocase subunit SecD
LKNNLKIPLIILSALIGFGALLALALNSAHIAQKVRVWKLKKDMTGGTSLVYDIDTKGLSEEQKKDLSKKMIAVLEKRVDQHGDLPIVWKPLSETRFEIQISPGMDFLTVKDIQRMLKGAGILEFRILPTEGHPEVDMTEIKGYIEHLKEKGPEQASDNNYVWCEIENFNEWNVADGQNRPVIVAQFSDKYYVLASNQAGQVMLHNPGERDWKLKRAYPTTDYFSQRAIGFVMDETGRQLMANVTGNNIGRPLCIILDGIALSAPDIEERIPGGQGQITGNFTQTQIEDMVNKLNAGCLPAKLIDQPVEIKTIGLNKNPNNSDTINAVGN